MLVVAPDGELHTVPLPALPLDGTSHVLHRYEVVHTSSGRNVLEWGRTQPPAGNPIVMAAPDFDCGVTHKPADGTRLRFSPLTGTRDEGAAVAKRLGVRPLKDSAASKPALTGARSPSVLHLATHGFFFRSPLRPGSEIRLGLVEVSGSELPSDSSPGSKLRGRPRWRTRGSARHTGRPCQARSCAPASRSRGPTRDWRAARRRRPPDGLLTALDVMALVLTGTRLVVLSACDTGLGDIRPGEGVFGLRRSFGLAGARTLVISLWKVPDTATAWLMERFYTHLAGGLGCAAALREAQREAHARDPDVYSWGAFVCDGNPAPLDIRVG